MDLHRRKLNFALFSVLSNTTLVIMKLAVGLMIGSVSIMSEAIHSGVDLLAAIIATFSVKTSGIPADTRHPFGHGKVENISGTIEALLIFLAAIWIILEAINKLLHPVPIEYVSWGIVVMVISTVVNIIVSKMLFKVAKDTDSIALEADAWHLRTDVYTSLGVMVSLAMIWLGHQITPDPNIYWLDPVAAIGVALLILGAAYKLTVQSVRDLMDVKLPAEEEAWIRNLITTHQPIIHGFHQLRTRKAGNVRFVDFHIKVDPYMSVEESHQITDELSASIENHFPKTSVTIHTEPCDGNCVGNCLTGCLLNEKERKSVMQRNRRS
ncbi:MAG TPA: cation diffusion facilitator family transporter [Syntrophales bacterium]|nr:cation diffusion facilitator family transporter [Syntrophales bacterium]